MARAENELICDFAEIYHVFDYQALPVELAATLSLGLLDDSRTFRKLNGLKAKSETMLLAAIADRLAYLVWFQTKDGTSGVNRPHLLTEALIGKEEKPTDIVTFETKEQLDRALAEFEKR